MYSTDEIMHGELLQLVRVRRNQKLELFECYKSKSVNIDHQTRWGEQQNDEKKHFSLENMKSTRRVLQKACIIV